MEFVIIFRKKNCLDLFYTNLLLLAGLGLLVTTGSLGARLDRTLLGRVAVVWVLLVARLTLIARHLTPFDRVQEALTLAALGAALAQLLGVHGSFLATCWHD